MALASLCLQRLGCDYAADLAGFTRRLFLGSVL
jgi:hypothetical protein